MYLLKLTLWSFKICHYLNFIKLILFFKYYFGEFLGHTLALIYFIL